jgi:type I restriction enzyme S subunit
MSTAPKTKIETVKTGADSEQPEGWAVVALSSGLISDVQPGFACGQNNRDRIGVAHLRPMNVSEDGEIELRDLKYVPGSTISGEQYLLRRDDVLFNNTNSSELVGKTACYGLEEAMAFSNHMTRLRCRPEVLMPRYCALALHQLWREGYFQNVCNNHVSQASVSRTVLLETEIPIPPIHEQKRITEQVMRAQTDVNKAKERLDATTSLLKHFRQAVPAAACSGKLTEDWRNLNQNVEPAEDLVRKIAGRRKTKMPDIAQIPTELPETWASIPFGFLIVELRNGISTKPEIKPPGKPILRISAVRSGKVALDDHRYLRNADTFSEYRLRDGDLLFTRYNGSLELLGVCGMVRGLKDKLLLYPDKLMRVRFDHDWIVPAYAELFFASPSARERMTEGAVSSAGQQGVSGAKVKNQPFALPPVEEQHEIVRRVEALFKLADAVEKRVAAASARAEKLTQAILAKAFRGELVPTEAELARREGRSYEPASVLLDRIKKETAVVGKVQGAVRKKKARAGLAN